MDAYSLPDAEVLLDTLPIGVSVYGPDDRLLFVNRAYAEALKGAFVALGERRETIVSRRVEAGEFGPGDPAAQVARLLQVSREGPEVLRRRRPNGRMIEVRTVPLATGGLVNTIADITALVAAEEELSRRLGEMEEMLANIQHGIVLYDKDRRLVARNPLLETMLGLPPGLLRRGQPAHDAVQALLALGEYGTGPEAAAFAARWQARDHSRAFVHQRVTRSGRVLEVRSNPTRSGGTVNIYTDITDLRANEAELRRAKEKTEASSAAKSRFLATIGHELLTPLNVVIGFSELLVQEATGPLGGGPGDSARVGEFAGAIHAAGKRLLGMLNAVLDVARIEQSGLDLATEAIDVRHLADATLRHAAASAATAGIALESRLAPDLPALAGDARRLRQTLDHLLANAIKFTPAGGSVMVEFSVGSGENLVVRVSDTGIGIAESELEQVFLPFHQAEGGLSRRFEGAGLGLFLSRAVAEAHGGTLALESAPGEGTTAILRLPTIARPSPPQPPEQFSGEPSGDPP